MNTCSVLTAKPEVGQTLTQFIVNKVSNIKSPSFVSDLCINKEVGSNCKKAIWRASLGTDILPMQISFSF